MFHETTVMPGPDTQKMLNKCYPLPSKNWEVKGPAGMGILDGRGGRRGLER